MVRQILVLSTLVLAAGCAARGPAAGPPVVRGEYLAVPNGRIYYEVAGQGPAVVLIHGGFGDRRMWDDQFDVLARSHRVIRYDHRGFGRSSYPDSAYSPVADVRALLDHLGIAKAHVVGNSMGGGHALDFALLHPDRVDRVVVVASGANGYPYTDADFASMTRTFQVGAQVGLDTAAVLWLHDPMIAVASSNPRSAARVRQMVLDNKAIFRMRNWPFEPVKTGAYDRLSELHAPVLLIVGDRDVELVRRVAAATAARLPNARLVTMPNADHLPQMVDPDAFTRLLLEFLDQ